MTVPVVLVPDEEEIGQPNNWKNTGKLDELHTATNEEDLGGSDDLKNRKFNQWNCPKYLYNAMIYKIKTELYLFILCERSLSSRRSLLA